MVDYAFNPSIWEIPVSAASLVYRASFWTARLHRESLSLKTKTKTTTTTENHKEFQYFVRRLVLERNSLILLVRVTDGDSRKAASHSKGTWWLRTIVKVKNDSEMVKREQRKGSRSVWCWDGMVVWTVSITLPRWPQGTNTLLCSCVLSFKWSSVMRRVSEKTNLWCE